MSSNSKSIIIVSYNFFPENNPRAFRTLELVKEFSRRGFQLTLVIPEYDHDYSEFIANYHVEIVQVPSGYLVNKKAKSRSYRSVQNAKKNAFLNKILNYGFYLFYMGGRHFEFWHGVSKYLKSAKRNNDLLISIGLPFSVHIGSSMGMLFNKDLCKTSIADYGDPFSYNAENKFTVIHRIIEKIILRKFDFISVPIPDAVPSYLYFKDRDKIKVIPQGYNLRDYNIVGYQKRSVLNFAYAGIFYSQIRNPQELFEYLVSLTTDFTFTIFTDMGVYDNRICIEPYIEKLGSKLVIIENVPRKECLEKLGAFDFLINIENSTKNQTPSKLIDYAIVGRPVFSYKHGKFEKECFQAFMEGDYSGNYLNGFNLNNYAIETIADNFLNVI